jgi:origin recognition complex subunit 1
MRHPFEAYVKFWEALTGWKHVGPHEKACEKLERHFTDQKESGGSQDNTVSVVLLDEIDYLITDKQSVLYNFFDWPKRAAEVPNGRRLIVIGISNTLNLAEQLMPSVQSRVGSERIAFNAYNLKDTIAILKSKIKEASPVSYFPSYQFFITVDLILIEAVRRISLYSKKMLLCLPRRKLLH